MTPTLTALNGLLAILAWQGQTGITYTVQTSHDLRSWSTLPAVFNGGLEELTVALETGISPIFTRLRASAVGDTNENGLPDQWELSQFGILDVDPMADPDNDGAGNHTEWLAGTDPLDYFNGERPRILLASGSQWVIPANEISVTALSLTLTHSTGEPWPNAPVSLHLQSGTAGILKAGESASEGAQEVIAYTDSMGRITPFSHSIHVLGSPQPGHRDQLNITAGEATAALGILTVSTSIPRPPRNLKVASRTDGSLDLSWNGDPGEAKDFLVETLTEDGDWISLAEIPVHELPDPDPATGRFLLSITANSNP